MSGKAGSENRLKNHSFPHSVQRATPWNPPRQPDCSRHLYSHSSLSFLLPPSWDQSRHWFLSSFNSFFRCSWDDTFSTDPFWLCSRLSFYMVAAEPAITTRRSAHSHSDRSETNSLPARPITVRPTHSQPLVPFFQRRCPNFSSSVPKARAFLAFEVSSLPSSVTGTTIRAVPSCIDLLPPLGVVLSYSSWDFFPLSHDPFLLLQHTSITIATFTSSLLFKSGSSLSLFFLPLILFVFLLSLTACRTFGSLH